MQIRDENRFVYRRRGDRDEGAVAKGAVVEDEVMSASVKEPESECVGGGDAPGLLEAVESEILKRNQARISAYVTSLKDLSRSQMAELMLDTGANGHFVGSGLQLKIKNFQVS